MAFFEESARRSARPTRCRAFERSEGLRLRPSALRAMDPRAPNLKRWSQALSGDADGPNWYAITNAVEEAVIEQKSLWPNVDLYSGSVYRYLGIATDLFTPVFARSRVARPGGPRPRAARDNKIIRPAGLRRSRAARRTRSPRRVEPGRGRSEARGSPRRATSVSRDSCGANGRTRSRPRRATPTSVCGRSPTARSGSSGTGRSRAPPAGSRGREPGVPGLGARRPSRSSPAIPPASSTTTRRAPRPGEH